MNVVVHGFIGLPYMGNIQLSVLQPKQVLTKSVAKAQRVIILVNTKFGIFVKVKSAWEPYPAALLSKLMQVGLVDAFNAQRYS